MKKNLLLLLFLLPVLSSNTTAPVKVYVCTGKSAYAYHKNKECRGLTNCMDSIKHVTLEKAKEMERKPCGICHKKNEKIN